MIPFAAFTFRQVTAGRNAGIWVIGAIIIIIFPVHLKSLHLKKCIIKWPTNLKVIQSVMGHKDIQTTMDIYAEATEEKKTGIF